MSNIVTIAEAMNGMVRIRAARTTEMVEEARKAHDCWPTSAAALGRTMSAAAIMGTDLKNENETITVVINGHGPAGTVLVQAKGNGDVRGFVANPQVYLSREDGHLDVGKAVGTDGTLTVTKNLGLKEPFTGVVDLQSGEIGQDFAYYFAISEQTPTIVSVGVLVAEDYSIKASGGMIIQLMPGADEACIEACEKIAAEMKPMSDLVLEGNSAEDIIRMYFPDAEIIGEREIRWHCGCSREGFFAALKTLAEKDLQEMIDDDKGAEITCQYCSKQYSFTTADLKRVLEEKNVEDRLRCN